MGVFTLTAKDERTKFSPHAHKQLFHYAKGHDASWTDPNAPLMPAPAEVDVTVSAPGW